METLRKLTSQQTGKCGELLVQYQLLKHGVESAPMTTDYGVDLVAFHAAKRKTVTIQVKTSTHRGTVEDKWVIWEIPEDCPADFVAAVDLERDKLWLFPTDKFKAEAAHSAKTKLRLWWNLPGFEAKRSKRREEMFRNYEMEAGIAREFGSNKQ